MSIFIKSLPHTHLSIWQYAEIMRINPVHFAGGDASAISLWGYGSACAEAWPKYAWQNADQIGRYDLALVIEQVERELEEHINYFLSPRFVEQEIARWPGHGIAGFNNYGIDVHGKGVSVKTRSGRLIQPGQRAVSLIGTATTAGGTLVYSDEDGDGFYELATITLPTAVTTASEIHVYYAGQGGDPEFEIYPVEDLTISGGNVVIKIYTWKLIDPDLYEAAPDADGFDAIDVSTTSNFVTSLDVYRQYVDSTQTSAQFLWGPLPGTTPSQFLCEYCGSTGCPACSLTTQNGCAWIRDAKLGYLTPQIATYSADNAQWSTTTWTKDRDPDQVKLWYYAGDASDRYLQGFTMNPLRREWAEVIAWMTTARLERPLCDCSNVNDRVSYLREELSFSGRDGSYNLPFAVLENPFGTRRGEVMAWHYVQKTAPRMMMGVAI